MEGRAYLRTEVSAPAGPSRRSLSRRRIWQRGHRLLAGSGNYEQWGFRMNQEVLRTSCRKATFFGTGGCPTASTPPSLHRSSA